MSEQRAFSRDVPLSVGKLNTTVARCERARVSPALKMNGDLPCVVSDDAGADAMSERARSGDTSDDLNSEFLTVLSHELRNSLCVIRMAARILHMEVPASAAVEKARTLIEHQTVQMSRLVEDLLSTSRASGGHMALRCEKVDLCAVAAQAVRAVEFTMQRRRHCMTTSFAVGPLWLQADPDRLEQVFMNLLFNAAKYTRSGGSIHLSVERDKGEGVVRIRDNGIGIAPNVLPRVFELFVQADPWSRRAQAGLGIGLALVRNVVDRHGGCVTVASAGLGHGSEFVVRLPMSG